MADETTETSATDHSDHQVDRGSPRKGTSRPSDAILVAISSALAYAVAYAFETKYLSWYGVPTDYLELSIERIVVAWTALFFVFAGGFVILGELPAWRWLPIFLRSMYVVMFGGWAWVTFLLFRLQGIGFMNVFFTVLLVITASLWVYVDLVRPMKAAPLGKKLEAMAALDSAARAVKPRQVKDWLDDVAPNSFWLWILLFCTVISFGAARFFGGMSARLHGPYLVSISAPECAVIRRYSDHLLCLQFNRQLHQFGRVLRILPASSVPSEAFRVEYLWLQAPGEPYQAVETVFF